MAWGVAVGVAVEVATLGLQGCGPGGLGSASELVGKRVLHTTTVHVVLKRAPRACFVAVRPRRPCWGLPLAPTTPKVVTPDPRSWAHADADRRTEPVGQVCDRLVDFKLTPAAGGGCSSDSAAAQAERGFHAPAAAVSELYPGVTGH